MNGPLSCSALNCVHNINSLCSANKIHVTGMNAVTSDDTQCKTFAEKGLINAVTNIFNMNIPGEIRQVFNNDSISMSPRIECDATRCIYNSNRICDASNVQIMGIDANSSENTQCETFKE
jgi:hypothetical protein